MSTMSPAKVVLLLFSFLVFGSMNTILTKVQFTMTAVGLSGEPKTFGKPWFQTFNMMLAMSYVLSHRCCKTPEVRVVQGGPSYKKQVLLVSVPAFFDILATALGVAGMMYIPASLWQMLRGSALIFACIFSIVFLRFKMKGFHWLGLILCVLGVTIVGGANILDASNAPTDPNAKGSGAAGIITGISLVVVGQVVQAAQVIAEEYLMKGMGLPAFDIVGFEGVWGVLQMIIIVYPILYLVPGNDEGHQEDVFDTLYMFGDSAKVLGAVLSFQFSCATFNLTGIAITDCLSAVHRMMVDASRTMTVWGFGLFVHYAIDESCAYGEKWTKYSFLQFFGFCVLVSGQAVYGQVVRVPCLNYQLDPADAASPSLPRPPTGMSPDAGSNLCKSPAAMMSNAHILAFEERAGGRGPAEHGVSLVQQESQGRP